MISALVARLERTARRPVLQAPASIDAALALLGPDRIVVAVNPASPLQAALAAGVRGTTSLVLAGAPVELERCLVDPRWTALTGRLLLARDWLADPDRAFHGRLGAAHAAPFAVERPRTLAENPLPASERVRAALVAAATSLELRRYPPLRPVRLLAALASREGVGTDSLVVSAGGSMELLDRILRATCDPGDEVLAAPPAWDALAAICHREGLVLRLGSPETITAATRLVYVVSPGVPDSARVPEAALARIRQGLAPDRLLVLDEAYRGFDGLDPVLPDPALGPVVRLRSFSKAEGLAGLRLGYALAPPAVIRLLEGFGDPYSISELAEEAAVAAVQDTALPGRVRQELSRLRSLTVNALRARGFEVPDSTTHVLLARPPPARLSAIVALADTARLPLEECPGRDGWLQLAVLDEAALTALVSALDRL